MMTGMDAFNLTAAREIYGLLDKLDNHIDAGNAEGLALLYQAKERVRLLLISIDRVEHAANSRGSVTG